MHVPNMFRTCLPMFAHVCTCVCMFVHVCAMFAQLVHLSAHVFANAPTARQHPKRIHQANLVGKTFYMELGFYTKILAVDGRKKRKGVDFSPESLYGNIGGHESSPQMRKRNNATSMTKHVAQNSDSVWGHLRFFIPLRTPP